MCVLAAASVMTGSCKVSFCLFQPGALDNKDDVQNFILDYVMK